MDYFTQQEGYAQGCPLGPILASLCLLLLLKPINHQLTSRAAARARTDPGDDGQGTRGSTASYLDDTSCCLHPADIVPLLQTIQTRGPPLGIFLNFSKLKLLTTTTGVSITTDTNPDPDSRSYHLQAALAYIETKGHTHERQATDTEVTTGLRFLGQPLGSSAFANQFLDTAASTYSANLATLQASSIDLHTKSLLYRACSIPSLHHLLASDVYYNASLSHPPALSAWTSPFLTRLATANTNFLAHLADTPSSSIHPTAMLIAHHPLQHGGLGFRDPTLTAIPSFLISLTRSLRYSTCGVPRTETRPSTSTNLANPIPLSATHAQALQSWGCPNTSQHLFLLYQRLMPQLLATAATLSSKESAFATLQSFVKKAPLQRLSQSLYQHYTSLAMKEHLTTAPLHITQAFPSILSSHTSAPLAYYHRSVPNNRLPNDTFTTLLQRKLRLPCLPPELLNKQCRHCQTTLDPFGDHLFQCRNISKTALHNQARDTLYTICTSLAPLAGLVHTTHGISRETPSLLPQHIRKRPADVALTIRPQALFHPPPHPVSTVAIDVTITRSTPATASTQPISQNLLHRAHIDSELEKLSCRHYSDSNNNVTAATFAHALLSEGILLLPFTIDPFGGLGPSAHKFLFGKTPKPPFTLCLTGRRPAPHTRLLYAQLQAAPTALLTKATKAANLPADPTTYTPAKWAHQALGLNLSIALAKHIHTAIVNLSTPQHNQAPNTYVGTTFITRTLPPTILDPLPPLLTATA